MGIHDAELPRGEPLAACIIPSRSALEPEASDDTLGDNALAYGPAKELLLAP
ncbi:MAG: hypothetical protein AAGB18_04395 [Pseudomonadota bacterium]